MSHWRTRIGDKLDILLQETLRIAQAKSGQKRGVHGQIKKELRRRSAIEAVIGHCKTDGHLDRNFLHGHLGDQINAHEALRMGLVNKVVPGNRLMAEAEAMARKLASLPQPTVLLNKLLVNRAYALAGFREALAYQDVPEIAAIVDSTRDDEVSRERLKKLTEEGWGAFIKNRDALHQDQTE